MIELNMVFKYKIAIFFVMYFFTAKLIASTSDTGLVISNLSDSCRGKQILEEGPPYNSFILNFRKCYLNKHDPSGELLKIILEESNLHEKLSYLFLGFNGIKSIESKFIWPNKLRQLGLAGNKLKKLHRGISRENLPLIKKLFLSKNRNLILTNENFEDLKSTDEENGLTVVAYFTNKNNKSSYTKWKSSNGDDETQYLFDQEDYLKYIEKKQLSSKSDISIDSSSYKSKNVSCYGRMAPVQFVMMHYTAGGLHSSLRTLTNKVSTHYVVPENSISNRRIIYKLSAESARAWHAGKGTWLSVNNKAKNEDNMDKKIECDSPKFNKYDYDPRTDMNSASIGIEIVNEASQEGNLFFFVEYPDYQIDSVIKLYKDIESRYSNIKPLGHADSSMTKTDPGPLFPWKFLYEEANIGIWYNESDKSDAKRILLENHPGLNDFSSLEWVSKALKSIGYNAIEKNMGNVIRAFQMRFRSNPHLLSFNKNHYTKTLDINGAAILAALYKKYHDEYFLIDTLTL